MTAHARPHSTWLLVLLVAACHSGEPVHPGAERRTDGAIGDSGAREGGTSEGGVGDMRAAVIATLGAPCDEPSALACAGHAQKLVLICSAGPDPLWVALQTCAGEQLCDSMPGPNVGSCQDPVAARGGPLGRALRTAHAAALQPATRDTHAA